MRALFVLVLAPLLIVGCTPGIPTDDSFGTTALLPVGPIPPEFAEFNAYDASVNQVLDTQMCATSYQPLDTKAVGANPGRMVYAGGRCRTHIPMFGDPSEVGFIPISPLVE